MDDYVTKILSARIKEYIDQLLNAKSDAEIQQIMMSIPEPLRMQVMMEIMSGLTGGGEMYPPFEISSFNHLDSMISYIKSAGLIGKLWSAQDWGIAADLDFYEEKADLLKEWICLIKILKTLRDNTSSDHYRIRLKTDLSGNHIYNTSYTVEFTGNLITLHTNCYYYENFEKKKVEDGSDKRSVLEQLHEDTEDMVKGLIHQYFTWNQTNNDCPSFRLSEIYKEIVTLASQE